MVELPAEERGDFLHFKQALVRRYAAMEPTRDYNLLIISRTCTSYLVG